MKSGLKDHQVKDVTLPTAMKSGLKALGRDAQDCSKDTGYTPYRDEKRTESSTLVGQGLGCVQRSYTPYRDEKRTESTMCLSLCLII